MKQNVYSIYDRAVMDYAAPFFAVSDEAAFRAVKGAFSPQSQLCLYPSDYVIACLGSFDSETGHITPLVKELKEVKNLIPAILRQYALDGTYERGVEYEAKENPSAESQEVVF